LRPFESSRRVFVIAEADRMNEESQNALLKSLEEPSSFAHFVLVSSAPGRLLPTIPSRCRPVRFGPVPSAHIAALLEGEGVEPLLATACARLAGGDVDRARWLAGPGAAHREEAEAAARATLNGEETGGAGWKLAEPWRPLLQRADEAAAQAEEDVKEELSRRHETEPRQGRQGFVREDDREALRSRRRAL